MACAQYAAVSDSVRKPQATTPAPMRRHRHQHAAGGSLPTLPSPKGGPLVAMINKTSDHADQSALRWWVTRTVHPELMSPCPEASTLLLRLGRRWSLPYV